MSIITGFQVAALVAIIVALAIVLHMLEARRRINAMPMPKDENEQAKEDEKLHRRMVHEADAYNQACNMEPFCGEGKKKPVSVQERNAAAYEEAIGRWPEPIKLTPEQERRARSRAAVARAQEAARASKSSTARLHWNPLLLFSLCPWSKSRPAKARRLFFYTCSRQSITMRNNCSGRCYSFREV